MVRKKIIMIALMATLSLGTYCKTFNDKYWESTIDAIVQVESNGNNNAVNGSCVGPMQISRLLVKECNKILRENKSSKRYTLSDRKSLSKSKEMFYLFQKKYNPNGDIERAIRTWNGGLHYNVSRTNRYLRKVNAAMNK